MKFYHVAPASYQTGDALLSFDEQWARDMEPVWKWECDYVDTEVVCLFREDQLDEAREFIEEFLPDGKLLEINIDDDEDRLGFTKVSEGYTAIYRMIPAEFISELK